MRPTTYIVFVLLAIALITYPRFSIPERKYDTSFWDLSQIEAPVKAELGDWRDAGGVLTTRVKYYSERYGSEDVIIDGILFRPKKDGKYPAVIIFHGSFGTADSMANLAIEIAREGYVAFAISGPGQGKSTGPRETNANRLNLTSGPYHSYYYRLLYSAMRGITFLRTLPFVNPEKVGAIGASQGGLECLWLAALDDRLKTSIPVVAGGDFPFLIESGSFALGHLPKDMRADDERAILLMRYFDPIAYAPLSKIPVLMLAGTSDEFFPLQSFNLTFSALNPPKAINILPNVGHFSVQEGWVQAGKLWLAKWLKDEAEFSTVEIESISSSQKGFIVKARGFGVDAIVINYRESWPWSRWQIGTMQRSGDSYFFELPTSPVGYVLIAGGIKGGLQVTSTATRRLEPNTVASISLFLFFWSTFTLLWLARISLIREWKKGIERCLIWSLFWFTFNLPLFIGASTVPIEFWKLSITYELWIPCWLPLCAFLLFPIGLLLVAGSDCSLKALAMACTLLTGIVVVSTLIYMTDRANIAIGTALPAQIMTCISLLLEERTISTLDWLKKRFQGSQLNDLR